MGAMHTHPVEQLPVESAWELLCNSVFITEVEEMHSLRDVGVQIVEKCHGLPLAIKAIAGVLSRKERSKGEWEKILIRGAWSMDRLPDDLRGALYLSYEDLPSPLKQCFLYISLLPEDFEFSRRDVVKWWVVEGFAGTQNDESVELVDEYFEELVWRNLIQKVHSDFHISHGIKLYKIHDLLRSLAQFLSKDESFCGEGHDLTALPTTPKFRRLAFINKEDAVAIPEPFLQQKHLRTLFLREHAMLIGEDLLVKFPYLRVLCLTNSKIENVPDTVGNLRHLRLLDLEGTEISSLPESIKYLTNLQVLNLSRCKKLYTLPEGITRLCNLRFIDLQDTPLRGMPAGMGSLAQLYCFNGFRLGVDEKHERGCGLEELKSLSRLTNLSICNLERAVVVQKGQPVLRNKHRLKNLDVQCSWDRSVEYTEEEIDNIENVFEELLPPPCLERLKIRDYFGRRFPSWMMSSSLGTFLPRLRSLVLWGCRTILQLPPLGLLPELIHLEIGRVSGVVTMGLKFVGSVGHAMPAYFPKLEYLSINSMMGLEEWSVGGDEEEELIVIPCLRRLAVFSCPRLKSLPKGLRQSALKELVIELCPGLERVSELPALRELHVYDDELECLPEWLLGLLQQRWQLQQDQDDKFHLHLYCNSMVMRKCLMGCEYWPIIQSIPRFNAHSTSTEEYM